MLLNMFPVDQYEDLDDPDFQGIEFETYIGRYGILLCAIRIPSICVESHDRENGEVYLRSF